MIAMTIMVMVLSAVVVVSFGNQSFLAGGEISSEAMNKAQELLETAQAQARKDFNLVNTIASTTDTMYEKAVYVRLLPDLLTKEVMALIAWKDEHMLTRMLELTTLIANFDTPVGGNTCNSALSGDWHTPSVENSTTNFAQLVGDPAGTYTISDLDAYQGKLYVTASTVSGPTKPTFFIFNIANPASPALVGSVDNEGAGGTVSAGLHAVRIAEDLASDPVKTYAYAANAYGANYTTCDPVKTRNCGQLDILDVSSPSSPQLGSNLMLASSTAPFVTGKWLGNSLYYRNGYVLLGLAKVGGSGPEFHIIDVHNPSSMFGGSHILSPVGSFAVGHDVNAIAMRGIYAYVVTPNTQELQTLDMTDPNSLTLAGGFNSPVGAGNGKSLYLVGNNVYLGKTVPNAGADLHILDNTTPGAALAELGPGIGTPSSVNAVIVRDYLSFLLTNSDLRIYKTDDPTHPIVWGTLTFPAGQIGHATEPSMDCEDNRLYVTTNDLSGKGYLYVIKPAP